MERRGENEDHDEVRNEEGEGENRTEATFGFPILDTVQVVTMKKIRPSSLPTFYGNSKRTRTHFCSSSISFVGAIIIYKTLIN